MVWTHQDFRRIIVRLFESNILRKKREKAKIEALFKAIVKYNIKSNISKRKENSRHPSCMRMTVLLFQYKAGRGVEHGSYLRVHIQDNMERMTGNRKKNAFER